MRRRNARAPRLFSDDQHRVSALRPRERIVGRDLNHRQRRPRGHFAAHGRRGSDRPSDRAQCGLRLSASRRRADAEVVRHGRLVAALLLRYTKALITQMAQTAVCNRCHQMEQQLCRSLLLCLDRLQSNELTVTHELIANMFGVRRESVTTAAGKLQAAGLIRCDRGRITILDRPRLEQHVCECYAVVKAELARLLPPHKQVPSARVVVPHVDNCLPAGRTRGPRPRPSAGPTNKAVQGSQPAWPVDPPGLRARAGIDRPVDFDHGTATAASFDREFAIQREDPLPHRNQPMRGGVVTDPGPDPDAVADNPQYPSQALPSQRDGNALRIDVFRRCW